MKNDAPEMTLQELQDAVDAWISQWDSGYWSPLANLARLTEEVGELAREINHHHGEKPKKSSEAPSTVAEELGDVLFVVVTLANSLGISLEDSMKQVLAKYEVRDADRYEKRKDDP